MIQTYSTVNSFNAGELSPKLMSRTDVSQYSSGCKTLQNFVVTPYGGAERRPGTEYIGSGFQEFNDPEIRLLPFVVSSDVSYLLIFGDRYLVIYRNRKPLLDDSGKPIRLATPYVTRGRSEDDYAWRRNLDLLQTIQSADVMTIVHPDYPVMELRRLKENEFELREKSYEYPPMMEPNLDDNVTLKLSGTTGQVTVTAEGAPVFEQGNVNGYYQISQTRRNNEITRDFTGNAVTNSMQVYGDWTFTTHGTWGGVVTIERSLDKGVSWEDIRTYSSASDANVSTSGKEEERGALYRIRMSDYEKASTGKLRLCRILFTNPSYSDTGVIRIVKVNDSQHAEADIISPCGPSNQKTSEWAEGAWSKRRGYPRAIAFFEERMFFGGTGSQPQTVWGSKVGDWDNFLLQDKDDSAISFTLASNTVNSIYWFCQHTALIIGTNDSEWTLSSSSQDDPITPTNFRVRRQSVYGCEPIPAKLVGDVVLFVQRGGGKVREFVYNWERDGYVSPDLSLLAEHITKRIVDMTLVQLPDPVLWCVLGDGKLAAMTYDREQRVIAWHRHNTKGYVFSVCALPSKEKDDLYLSVERFADSKDFVVERLHEQFYPTSDEFVQMWFLDCAKIVTSTADNPSVYRGLEHLNGLEVVIYFDGEYWTTGKVSNGMLYIPSSEPGYAIVGLPYESILEPMPIEPQTQAGSSLLRTKIVGSIRIRCYNSRGGEVRVSGGEWQVMDFQNNKSDDLYDTLTGTMVINTLGRYGDDLCVSIRQINPMPLNVACVACVGEVD